MRVLLFPSLIATVLSVNLACAEEPGPEPFELVRTLQNVQDDIVQGSRKAQRIQQKVLQHTARRFSGFDAKVWSDRRNAKAAVIFTLVGGSPRISQGILSSGTLHKSYSKLMKAAIAVAQRNQSRALRHFKDIDPMKEPGHLGALVALVQGVLLTEEKPKKASRLFAMSGVLAPGTIIEDAALRRNLVVASKLKKLDIFFRTSASYIHRFKSSLFHTSFDKLFASQTLIFGEELLSSRAKDLEEILRQLPVRRRRALYLKIAKGAISRGMFKVTRFAAAGVMDISKAGTESFEQAQLYKAGVEVVSEDQAGVMKVLSGLNPQKLSKEDRLLVQKIKEVRAILVAWPPLVNASGTVSGELEPQPETSSPLQARADAVFKSVDAILE